MLSSLNNQPITQVELRHQNRSSVRPRPRRWFGRWMRRLMWMTRSLAYLLAFVVLANEIVGLVFMNSSVGYQNFTYLITQKLGILQLLPIFVVLFLHFRRMLQTITLSTHSIAREKQSNNWDMLVLTGIDAGKIVRGKWWATVRHQWKPYVVLGILRATLVMWYGASTNRSYYSYSYYSNGQTTPEMLAPMLLQCLLSGIVVFTFTIVNLLFTAACGVTAFNARSGVALARGIATRMLLLIGIVLTSGLIVRFSTFWTYTASAPSLFFSIATISLVTLADNGITVGIQLATYRFYNYYSAYGSNIDPVFLVFLPAAIIALLIYLVLTFGLLRFAQWQAVRQSALPPSKHNVRSHA
jgi:hypothetical protein